MSHNGTQTSSVESPPSSSATSMSASTDPGPGCMHLADFVQNNERAKQEFIQNLEQARSKVHKDLDSQVSTLQYHCIHCAESGDVISAEIHCTNTQHAFSFCPQTTAVYCAQCKDTIYHKKVKQESGGAACPPSSLGKKRRSSEVDEDTSYIDSNAAKRPCGREGLRGLFNLGHTCYMNAVIQTMIHNSLLSSFFLGKGHPRHTCCKVGDTDEDTPCVACGFTEIFSESRFSENTQPMAALKLLKASWLSIPEMQGERQHDAHEWYLQIIDKLHECETPSYNQKGVCRCFIHKAFFGRTRQEITCNKCGFISRTQDQMLYLSLDFQKQLAATPKKKSAAAAAAAAAASTSSANPSSTDAGSGTHPHPISTNPTMASCLEDFVAVENLAADDSYSCRGCSLPGKMTKSVRIRKLPAILCMQMNRFQNEIKGGNVIQKKIKGRVQYPLEIDLHPFTTKAKKAKTGTKGGGDSRTEETETAKKERRQEDDEEKQQRQKQQQQHQDTEPPSPTSTSTSTSDRFVYELESVIVHEGKAIEQGHYFAFCRAQTDAARAKNSTGRPREWYMFNDARVTVAAEPMVLEQEAYLLFYSLKRVCGQGRKGEGHVKAEPVVG